MKNTFDKIHCFVGLFDILGFSNLIETHQLDKVADLYSKIKKYFEEILNDANSLCNREIVKFYNFSDTFLVHTKNKDDINFQALLVACDALFLGFNETAQNDNIAIRGAITSGEIIAVEGIVVGQPIIEAFRREKQQEWIGCWISDQCLNKDQLNEYINDKSIVEYLIPFKDGIVKHCHAFNWVKSIAHKYKIDKKSFNFGSKEIMAEINFLKSEPQKWDVKRKHENTITFVKKVITSEFLDEYRTRKYESRK